MRIDRDGRLIQQINIWLPVELVQLLRADGINLSAFIREQIAHLYDDPGVNPHTGRERLAQAARESMARQRAAEAEREADRERARAAVRVMRAERDAANERQTEIAAALAKIIRKKALQYRRMLPENDPHGDRCDEWDALVRRVSLLCGAEIDSAEVAAGLRALIATKAQPAGREKGVRGE